jgi:Zn-finger nucleic acid-binding protein
VDAHRLARLELVLEDLARQLDPGVPAAGEPLQQEAGLQVDVCDGGCGGIWFDHYELQKVDEPSESAGEELLQVARNPALAVDVQARHACPHCNNGTIMMRHFESVLRRVSVDECPACGGVWLDAGELGAIRDELPSEEARHDAAGAYFSELFDGQLRTEHAKTEAELARAQKFANAFRFICPSYYAPGKQPGAAF